MIVQHNKRSPQDPLASNRRRMKKLKPRMHRAFAPVIALVVLLGCGVMARQAHAAFFALFRRQAQADLGVNASMNGWRPFTSDNPWNTRIDKMPTDPSSDLLLTGIGLGAPLHADFCANLDGKPFGIPYTVVDSKTPRVPITFQYAHESDPGPYPIPLDAPIEGGAEAMGDRHILVLDRDAGKLYELFEAYRQGNGYKAGSGAIFDLRSDEMRPAGWTSADAAGLPIFPGLVRYDEVVEQKLIRHALRFTVKRSRRAYVFPARHFASHSTSVALPPMGMRVRLKASYDISGFPPQSRVILQALKTYGMILADNGSDWFISGAPDPRWRDADLKAIKRVHGKDLEVVQMGLIVEGTEKQPLSR
jgi:hypothetical protein